MYLMLYDASIIKTKSAMALLPVGMSCYKMFTCNLNNRADYLMDHVHLSAHAGGFCTFMVLTKLRGLELKIRIFKGGILSATLYKHVSNSKSTCRYLEVQLLTGCLFKNYF